MEWLDGTPINLDGGFISLGVILCSMAVFIWVAVWFGNWIETPPSEDDINWQNVWLDGWWHK